MGDVMRVPVSDLQREFEASGLSAVELSRALGWTRQGKQFRPSDARRLRRTLGYLPQNQSHGYGWAVRTHVNATTAQAIRAAIAQATGDTTGGEG